MYFFTKSTMNAVIAILTLALSLTCLTGCKDEYLNQVPQREPTNEELEILDAKRFEEGRYGQREYLKKRAEKTPEDLAQASVSLMDYELMIPYLTEFQKKYPNLQITSVMSSIKGMVLWKELSPNENLQTQLTGLVQSRKESLEKRIKEAAEFNSSEPDTFSIMLLEALNAGNVRTFGFSVKGKIKDIEAMTEKEFDQTVRVIRLHVDLKWSVPSVFSEPIESNLKMDGSEKSK